MTPTLPELLKSLGFSTLLELEISLKALLTEKGFEVCFPVFTGIVHEKMRTWHSSALHIAGTEVNRAGATKAEKCLYVLAAARIAEGRV